MKIISLILFAGALIAMGLSFAGVILATSALPHMLFIAGTIVALLQLIETSDRKY